MLMKWRSLRTFMQADLHARQKKAHKNVRVNCNVHLSNTHGDQAYLKGKFLLIQTVLGKEFRAAAIGADAV